MKYQPGDIVLLLHSNEEGKVVELISETMVMIDIDGVRFPVYTDQIDFPYFKRFTEQRARKFVKGKTYIDDLKKEKLSNTKKQSTGVWVSFFPVYDKDIFDDDVVEKFKIYLVNHVDEAFQFNYQVNYRGMPDFHLSNKISPFTDFYLHDIPFEEMNDAPRLNFVFEPDPADKKKEPQFEASVKIKAKTLFQKLEEIRFKNEPSFSVLLFESYPAKSADTAPALSQSISYFSANRANPGLEPPRSMIDLHIEKITDNWQQLSNFEILSIQLKTFEKYYNLAVAHRQPNFIVVHGVGTGKLRQEIHELLKFKKEVRSFANQYHPNYGFGSTEIFFQY